MPWVQSNPYERAWPYLRTDVSAPPRPSRLQDPPAFATAYPVLGSLRERALRKLHWVRAGRGQTPQVEVVGPADELDTRVILFLFVLYPARVRANEASAY